MLFPTVRVVGRRHRVASTGCVRTVSRLRKYYDLQKPGTQIQRLLLPKFWSMVLVSQQFRLCHPDVAGPEGEVCLRVQGVAQL